MNHAHTLPTRVAGVHFAVAAPANSSVKAEQRTARAAAKSDSGSYLPGLRPVENEVEAYFNNDFARTFF